MSLSSASDVTPEARVIAALKVLDEIEEISFIFETRRWYTEEHVRREREWHAVLLKLVARGEYPPEDYVPPHPST